MLNTLKSFFFFIFSTISILSYSQTTHILDFNDSHTGTKTDTTLTVMVNDSIVILNHSTLDDDFEYIINNGTPQGAYGIADNEPIFKTKLTNNTINTIKIVCYDPLYYRLVTLNYTSTGIYDVSDKKSSVSVFPNPSKGNSVIIKHQFSETQGIIEVADLNGKIILLTKLDQASNYIALNTLGITNGIYLVTVKTATNQSKPEKLFICD